MDTNISFFPSFLWRLFKGVARTIKCKALILRAFEMQRDEFEKMDGMAMCMNAMRILK